MGLAQSDRYSLPIEKNVEYSAAYGRYKEHYLIFDIAAENLHGFINGKSFSAKANSGGGRTLGPNNKKGGINIAASLRPLAYTAHQKTSKSSRGGVIPMGWWLLRGKPFDHADGAPTDFSFQLYPTSPVVDVYKRDYTNGLFYVHGHGGRGSDGCILLLKEDRVNLNKLLNGNSVLLCVKFDQLGEMHEFDKRWRYNTSMV